MNGHATIINGNANSLPIADSSVDLIVTSPPYFALRDYKDGDQSLDGQIGSEPTPEQFLEALWTCAQEWWRVLKPSGSLWVNLGDKYSGTGGNNNANLGERATRRGPSSYSKATVTRPKSLMGLPWRYAIGMVDGNGDPDHIGWILRAEVIWAKPNGLPESVTDRVRRSHEQWFHFTKSERYYSSVDEIREPHAEVSIKRAQPHRANVMAHEDRHVVDMAQACNPLGKLPGSVWTVPTEPLIVPEHLGTDHFAAFPSEWPRRIILGWAPTHGICDTCGQGLRPVVDREPMEWRPSQHLDTYDGLSLRPTSGTMLKPASTTITGYACDCDTPGTTHPAVVLDPFGGTGTTAAVAKALGCHGISNDLSAAYCRLAEWRTNDPKLAAKVLERTGRPGPPANPDQLDLFGDVA